MRIILSIGIPESQYLLRNAAMKELFVSIPEIAAFSATNEGVL